jgi:FkbM family methyltransferase
MSLIPPARLRAAVLPFTRLHVPFASALLARRIERDQTERKVQCELHGVRWDLDLTEMVDFNIFYLKSYERFTSRRIMQFARPGGTFIDVGANIGYFTMRAARQLGVNGHVHAFEPMRRAYDRLVRHVTLNHLDNVTTHRLIVTDRSRGPQTVTFRNSWKMFGAAPEPQAPEQIETVSLDDYAPRLGLSRLDVMKIDVDGYEYKVLQGARETLRRFGPALVLEIGGYTMNAVGDSVADLVGLLEGLGYRFYSERTLRRFWSTTQLIASIPSDATINVVCLRE